MNLIGIDIGGTKCAVSLGCSDGNGTVQILHKCEKRLTEKRPPEPEFCGNICSSCGGYFSGNGRAT